MIIMPNNSSYLTKFKNNIYNFSFITISKKEKLKNNGTRK
jgi:hypothetical protein